MTNREIKSSHVNAIRWVLELHLLNGLKDMTCGMSTVAFVERCMSISVVHCCKYNSTAVK